MNQEGEFDKKDQATLMEDIFNFMEFEQKVIFTPKPQCIVGLMGVKASKIECGKNHVLLLTQDSQLYSWGSNEVGQLGFSKKETQKKIEFLSYVQAEEGGPYSNNILGQDDSQKGFKPFNTQAKPGSGSPKPLMRRGSSGKLDDGSRSPKAMDSSLEQKENGSPGQSPNDSSNMSPNGDPGGSVSSVTFNINSQLDALKLGVTKQSKVVTKHYSGVPRNLTHILGKIESISCGDQNSFAIVKV